MLVLRNFDEIVEHYMFNHLPNELKVQILNLIADEDIPEAALVSSEWRSIIMDRTGARYVKNYLNMYAEYDIDSIKSHRMSYIISSVTFVCFAYWFKDQPLATFACLLSLVSAISVYNIRFEKQYFAQEAQDRYSFFKTLQNESRIVHDPQNNSTMSLLG